MRLAAGPRGDDAVSPDLARDLTSLPCCGGLCMTALLPAVLSVRPLQNTGDGLGDECDPDIDE